MFKLVLITLSFVIVGCSSQQKTTVSNTTTTNLTTTTTTTTTTQQTTSTTATTTTSETTQQTTKIAKKETPPTEQHTAVQATQNLSRIVYIADNGKRDVYWYHLEKLRKTGANMNKVIEITEGEAIARGKRRSLKD